MSDEFFNQDGTGNVTDQTSDTGMYSAPESQTYSAPEPDVQSEAQSVQQETFNQGAAQEESVNQNYGSSDMYNSQQRYNNGNAYQQPVYGQATQKQKGDSIGFGIASLILGIASIFLFACCVNYILAILAIIFGIVQIVTNKRKGLAIGGIVTAGISIVIATLMWLFGFSLAGQLEDPSSPLYKYYEEYMDEYTSEYEDYM